MTHFDVDERTTLSDRAVSYLRTAVPALWGALVATLLGVLAPHLPADVYASLSEMLGSTFAQTLVVSVVIALWYVVWRRIEPHLPDWLVRLVLGSARMPAYAPVLADGTAVITSLSPRERSNLASLRDALDEGDPGRDALNRVLTT